MDNEYVKIEKLQGGDQWTAWKFQLRQILEAGDMYDVVTGVDVAPVAAAADYAAKYSLWKKADAKARKIIATSVGSQPLVHILSCETASEMWTSLKSVYESTTKSGVYFLQQKYYSFSKEPSDNMATFLSKLLDIVQQLKAQKELISDSMIMTKIQMALPPEYNYFHSAWDSTPAAERTLENMKSRLMGEEVRLQGQNKVETVEALLVKTNKKLKNSGKYQNKKKPRVKRDECLQCGEKGHWKKDCKQSKEKRQFHKPEEKHGEALVMKTDKNANGRDVWYIDSGAAFHMSNSRHSFDNFQELSDKVKVGNGSFVDVKGMGNINVLVYTGDEWVKKHITNVRYVPELYVNLFSTGKVTDLGYTVIEEKTQCKIVKDGSVVAVGVRDNGLYRMLIKVVCADNCSGMANVAAKPLPLHIWHEKLAHQNIAHVKSVLRNNNIDYIDEEFVCEACVYGKQHRISFEQRQEKATKCGELIHSDVCGPLPVESLGGSRYFLTLKDDYSRYRFVYFLKNKSEVFEKFKCFAMKVKNECGSDVKILRTDNGLEFVNKDMNKFCEENGIKHQKTVPYTPEQNGCAERDNRTLKEAARTLLSSKNLNEKLWAEAISYTVHTLNRTGKSTVENKTPYELWYEKSANINKLQIFGCSVYVHIPKEKRRGLDLKSKKCVFIGYDDNVKGVRVLNPESNKIEVARDVIFITDDQVVLKINNSNKEHNVEANDENDDKTIDDIEEDFESLIDTSLESNTLETSDQDTWCAVNEKNVVEERLRNRDAVQNSPNQQMINFAMVIFLDEPKTYNEAIHAAENKHWTHAMNEEYDALVKNRTWTLVKPPTGQKIIDNRWVFKVKQNTDGSIERYKARLVVRGFTQEYGIDYQETFSPVVKFTSIRSILALAAANKMKLKQFDIKTAFLNGNLEEDVYMKQPIGYSDGSGRVCKLSKSLYGLKQASRCWNKRFTNFIKDFGFTECQADPCVFVRRNKQSQTILAIYVDDGLIASNDDKEVQAIVAHLKREFEIKDFEAKCFLGFEIEHRTDGSIRIHQAAYAKRFIDRFHMTDCKTISTPMDPNQNLGDFKAEEKVDFPYREAVGSLMYLAVATRPDISFAVGCVSRYLENPALAHVNAVKRILRYIKATLNFGIVYEAKIDLPIIGYSDADYAGDTETRRSTSGYVFLFGSSAVSWGSVRQKSVSLSTTESEYIAASDAVKELVWLERLIAQITSKKRIKSLFRMDNQSAVRLIKNPEFHKRTKHVDVRYHFIREKFEILIWNL